MPHQIGCGKSEKKVEDMISEKRRKIMSTEIECHAVFVGLCKNCGGAMYFDFTEEKIIPHGGVDCICELQEEPEEEAA